MDNDIEIFKGKKFSSLCENIYINSTDKKDQLDVLISELRALIKDTNSAMMIVPLIKEYFDVSVRNDEHLVKLAAIVQRLINSEETEGEASFLTNLEKEQLMKEIENQVTSINKDEKKVTVEMAELAVKKEEAKKSKPNAV